MNYLVPELCYLTGLSDHAHRDARVGILHRRILLQLIEFCSQARKTNRLIPFDSVGRQAEISYFDDLFRRNPSTIKYLASWNIDMTANLLPGQPFQVD